MTSISNKKSKLHFLCKVGKRHSNLEFCLNNTNWKVFLVKAASVDASRSSYHHVILPCKSYFLVVVVTFVLPALQWYVQKHSSTALVLFSPSAEVKSSSSFMEKPLNTLKNVNHYPQTTTQNLTCSTHLRQLEIVRSKQRFWNVPLNEFHVNTEVYCILPLQLPNSLRKSNSCEGEGGKKVLNS